MHRRVNFCQILRNALEQRFGKHKITASELANAFNLITQESISNETARKWMTGLALPRYERIFELVHWLDIDPRTLFNYEPNHRIMHEEEIKQKAQQYLDGQFNLQDVEFMIKHIKHKP